MKKKILVLLVILLTVFTIPVFAKGDNGFNAGDKVKVKKDLNTTSFTAGNNVNMTSTIDGINFVAGNNVILSSNQDYLFAAGNMVTIKNINAKDAFIAGNVISIDSSSVRDLYVAGSNITIDSNIERNAYIGGESVTINGTIDGDVKVAAEKVTIGEEAVINGTLEYPDDAELNIEKGSTIAKKKKYKSVNVEIEKTTTKDIIKAKVSATLYSYVSLLLIAIILLALNKNIFNKILKTEKTAKKIAIKCLIGLGTLILTPIVSIIVMLTIIGIPLSIITLIIYGLLIYLSSIATAYYCGNWLLKDKVNNEYLQLIIALAVIYIIRLIPFIGGLVSFISLIFGLGIYTSLIINNKNEK